MSDIGLRCLLASVTGFVLIRGVIFANFQAEGNFCSVKVLFNMVEAGWARTSAKSFNNQFGKPSSLQASRGLSLFKAR